MARFNQNWYMGVTTGYAGYLGNNLFQYIVARLFAEKNGLQMCTPWRFDGIMPVSPCAPGIRYDSPIVLIDDNNEWMLDQQQGPALYTLGGFFQQSKRLYANRQLIQSWFNLQIPPKNDKDLIMHIRCGDYVQDGLVIHPDWYKSIIESCDHDKLYIVIAPVDEEYLSHFTKYNPIVMTADRDYEQVDDHGVKFYNPRQRTIDDIKFMASFDKIISSNGTYSWWAAFFGSPHAVYIFKPWRGFVPAIRLAEFPGSIVVDGHFYNEVRK